MLRTLNILLTPVLILHELTHALVGVILDAKVKLVEFKFHDKGHPVIKLNIRGLDKDWKVKAVAMSPFLTPFIFFLLTFLNINFVFVLVYLTLFYKTTLPSPTDFKVAGWVCPSFLEV